MPSKNDDDNNKDKNKNTTTTTTSDNNNHSRLFRSSTETQLTAWYCVPTRPA